MSRQDANSAFARTSFLYGGNAAYIDDLYAKYENDPGAVDAAWQTFFQSLKDESADVAKAARGASWKKPNWPPRPDGDLVSALDGQWAETEKKIGEKISAKAEAKGVELSSADVMQATRDSIHALMLIRAYRMRGHFHAKLDPLDLVPEGNEAELDPRSYGFAEADLDRRIFLDKVLGLEFASMREIVAILRRTYCQTVGVEFMHISNAAQKSWIQERIEGRDKEITFTKQGKRAILNKLVEAEGFEKFLDIKYTGTKRFGLDGGESLIPALEQIIKRGGNLGVKEIVIGMPHRGRLNVLTQVMGKPHRALFHEFKGGSANPDAVEGSGDVKYHLGASSDREFDNNKIHLSLTANPSHLEIVDPVVLGKVRAKQDQHGDPPDQRISVLPLLMHGDAAFAGQGEGRVAVHQQRQHRNALVRRIAMLILLGAHLAEHHGVDDLQMRRIGGQRKMDLVVVELPVRRCAEMVFDVAGPLHRVGIGRAALEFVKQRTVRLAHHLRQHVEAAAVRHPDHDFLHAKIAAALDDLLERRDQ